jgi:hypothetical protein
MENYISLMQTSLELSPKIDYILNRAICDEGLGALTRVANRLAMGSRMLIPYPANLLKCPPYLIITKYLVCKNE